MAEESHSQLHAQPAHRRILCIQIKSSSIFVIEENADTEIKGSLCFDPQNQQAGVGRVRKVRPGSRVIVEW